MKPLIACLAPLSLCVRSACAPAPVGGGGGNTGGGGGICAAADYQGLVSQSEVALSTMALPGEVRIIHPGDAVTKDFRPDRMNIHIDGNGRIAQVDCG